MSTLWNRSRGRRRRVGRGGGPRARRGLVLLLTLTLLTLFLIMGVTFVVISGTFRASSRSYAQQEITGVNPDKLTYAALLQVLRGSSDRSVLRGHELLEDFYGRDGVKGQLTGNAAVDAQAGGQFLIVNTNITSPTIEKFYVGRVFSFITGPATGLSARVAHYEVASGVGRFWIEYPDYENAPSQFPQAGNQFIINGAPFNGPGHGYSDGTGNIDLTVPWLNVKNPPVTVPPLQVPVALLPNFDAYNMGLQAGQYGADESFDVPDYRDMFLALVPVSASVSGDIIPSFHRPELIQYWQNHPGVVPNDPDFLRRVILRPMPFDHPNFTGGNPYFDLTAYGINQIYNHAINGPWDVDNDGDGVTDSVWLDIGLPVASAPDGRLYKPLAALLIQDLDGRLNVNAHSSLAQNNNPAPTPFPPVTGLPIAGFNTNLQLPRGRGHGPAEIYIGHVAGGEFQNLLLGKYGNDGRPGNFNANDLLSAVKQQGTPANYSDGSVNSGAYGSPPDVWGHDVTVLDLAGGPLSGFKGLPNPLVDDPYEIDLLRRVALAGVGGDSPYSIAELERLLRWNDADAMSLPDRLRQKASNMFNTAANRALFTTHSSHVPGPKGGLPEHLRSLIAKTNAAPTILHMYQAKLQAGGVLPPNLQAELNKIVPFEFLHGENFNVNRPFGNGQDDNGDGVVDNEESGEFAWPGFGFNFGGPTFNHLNNQPGVGAQARQMYARQLFCLMMLLVDPDHLFAANEGLNASDRRELATYRIAQWAINTVDFRDADAIMTPFEYDVNPWNGWALDNNPFTVDVDPNTGNPLAERRMIWGCEPPDLLLTETVAFHDRRVKDTDKETNKKKRRKANKKEDDKDLDQYRIPQGSLFVELLCPRTRPTANPQAPRELYNVTAGNAVLDLEKISPPDGTDRRHPVWRVAITKSHHTGSGRQSPRAQATARPDTMSFQPENLNLLNQLRRTNGPTLDIERVVWFTRAAPASLGFDNPNESELYFFNRATGPARVQSGQYCVVGPREQTHVGMRPDAAVPPMYKPAEQRILLNRNGVGMNVLDILNNSTFATPGSFRPVVTVLAASAPPQSWTDNTYEVGVNVSEPLAGAQYYDEPTESLAAGFPKDSWYNYATDAGELPDQPFDSRPNRPLQDDDLLQTGTTQDYKTALLQRLANPLAAHHPVNNPYITVDWSPIDLTVFNGEDRKPSTWDADEMDEPIGPFDPDDPDPDGNPPEQFDTRERNGAQRNLWAQVTENPADTAVVATPPAADEYFAHNLRHSLGFLNQPWQPALLAGFAPAEYIGEPDASGPVFPWLTWFNRPFATPLEMALVPASSPSRLLHEHRFANGENPYNGDAVGNFRAPYAHLLNFFHHQSSGDDPPHYYRLFDYVEAPSPYANTERWYKPDLFALSASPAAATFRPPFNRLSRFRDPGRININTITDARVWEGIAKQFPSMDSAAFWNKVAQSRQGYGGAIFSRNTSYPTRFARPFQPAARADMAPMLGLNDDPRLRAEGIEATLLRSDPGNGAQPLFRFESGDVYQDTTRNAFFHYQGLSRLGNMLTTNSNVFAIWVTVGYFEVEPNPAGSTAALPSGYRLSRELATETQGIQRHRAFYIVDRSIPVAYETGKNHNVERCVLLRRAVK